MQTKFDKLSSAQIVQLLEADLEIEERSSLQALAKMCGVKANGTSAEIRKEIGKLQKKLQDKQKKTSTTTTPTAAASPKTPRSPRTQKLEDAPKSQNDVSKMTVDR